jgi:hypothetical protein
MGKRRIDFRKVDDLKERTKQFTLYFRLWHHLKKPQEKGSGGNDEFVEF